MEYVEKQIIDTTTGLPLMPITTDEQVLVGNETLKEVLAHLPGGESAIDDVKVNGNTVVVDKVAEITVPTKVSELENDSDFVEHSEISNMVKSVNSVTPDTDGNVQIEVGKTYTAGTNIIISEDNVISATSSGGDFDYDNAVNNTVVETLQTTNKTVVGAINEIMEYDIPFAENLRF